MAYRLFIKEEASLEILDAYQYYEEQQNGLGDRFLIKLQDRFTDIAEHPEYYGFVDSKRILRDVAVNGFPFVIVYDIIGVEVTIYTIHLTYKKPRA